MTVGSRGPDGQGNATPVADQMALAAAYWLRIRGIWSRFAAPKTARTEQLSTTAFDQVNPILSRESQFSNAK